MGIMKYAVCIPYYGLRDPDHLACVDVLRRQGVPILIVPNCPYVDMARCMLAKLFLTETDADIMMFIDHDIIFQPKQVGEMCQRLHDTDWDILGACYSHRRPSGGLIGHPMHDIKEAVFYQPGIIPALILGMGFCAIKRQVFERLDKHWTKVYCPTLGQTVHPYFMGMLDNSGMIGSQYPVYWHGEDVSFLVRARQVGCKIGIDLEPRIYHRGKMDYAIEDAAFNAASNAPSVKVTWDVKMV